LRSDPIREARARAILRFALGPGRPSRFAAGKPSFFAVMRTILLHKVLHRIL
jgi:hypothetical protein